MTFRLSDLRTRTGPGLRLSVLILLAIDSQSPTVEMQTSMTNGSMPTMMVPWLHFTGGDRLFFQSLHPTSSGAIAGACIVLALLSIFDRWIAARRNALDYYWRQRLRPPSLSPDNPEAKLYLGASFWLHKVELCRHLAVVLQNNRNRWMSKLRFMRNQGSLLRIIRPNAQFRLSSRCTMYRVGLSKQDNP